MFARAYRVDVRRRVLMFHEIGYRVPRLLHMSEQDPQLALDYINVFELD
jgi:hypothetical protein